MLTQWLLLSTLVSTFTSAFADRQSLDECGLVVCTDIAYETEGADRNVLSMTNLTALGHESSDYKCTVLEEPDTNPPLDVCIYFTQSIESDLVSIQCAYQKISNGSIIISINSSSTEKSSWQIMMLTMKARVYRVSL